MTRIILLSESIDMMPFAAPLLDALPDARIVASNSKEADVAVCWQPPAGALARVAGLKLIHSIAAGADHILQDPALPDVPLCRVVDPLHAQGMTEFVMWGVLHFHRRIDHVMANQRHEIWDRPEQVAARDRTIGVMGLGALGLKVAGDLHRAGFKVRGWSRERKSLPGIETFNATQVAPFLAEVDILVCLLPLTAETTGILDRELFAMLPRGAKQIHVGRGAHLVTDDAIAALESGQLGGAVIDVFEQEPLVQGHPLWRAPNLIVTPHMASVASAVCIGEQIAANILRLERGEPLANQVDLIKGY
jgi:glyoxylate/hydroxypyruvate reductase A